MSIHLTVFGDPIEHSLSPILHYAFAQQFGIDLLYTKTHASKEVFSQMLTEFYSYGGIGANVTVPLKEHAFELCTKVTDAANLAKSVNTLKWQDEQLLGTNTDGAGFVQDLTVNHHQPLEHQTILLLGAGGGARGLLGPLLDQNPNMVYLANRTFERAINLCDEFDRDNLVPMDFERLDVLDQKIDVIINATSSSLNQDLLPIPDFMFVDSFVYDLMYSETGQTPLTQHAKLRGARHAVDGLGMLVEQGALGFEFWFDKKPETQSVIRALSQQVT